VSHLLDVSLLLACGWSSHTKYAAARRWLESQSNFTTSPVAELGFIRVSMTPGYRASFEDAQSALSNITTRKQARWVPTDLPVARLPLLQTHAEVTDAYLVQLCTLTRSKARDFGRRPVQATMGCRYCREPALTHPMADEFPYDIFLSHSAKDKAVVRPLAERLRADGVKVWFDE